MYEPQARCGVVVLLKSDKNVARILVLVNRIFVDPPTQKPYTSLYVVNI